MQKCCIPYIPCRSLLLSTIVLNDIYVSVTDMHDIQPTARQVQHICMCVTYIKNKFKKKTIVPETSRPLVAVACLAFNQHTGWLFTHRSRYLGERLSPVCPVATPFCGLKEGIWGIKTSGHQIPSSPKYQPILNNRGLTDI